MDRPRGAKWGGMYGWVDDNGVPIPLALPPSLTDEESRRRGQEIRETYQARTPTVDQTTEQGTTECSCSRSWPQFTSTMHWHSVNYRTPCNHGHASEQKARECLDKRVRRKNRNAYKKWAEVVD